MAKGYAGNNAGLNKGTIRLHTTPQHIEVAMTGRCDETEDKIEITPDMIEAGAEVILCEVGGADLGGLFSAADLALAVLKAMMRDRVTMHD